jgi:hypothetical protein
MKRILLLTVLLITTISTFAQRGATGASLKIKLSTNQMLSVSVDDRYYERRGTSLTIGNIPNGRHYLKVYNYRIGRSGNGRANMVYSGYVDLKASTHNTAVVDPIQRKMTMRTVYTYIREQNDPYENWNDKNYDKYDNDDYNNNYNSSELRNQDITDLGIRVKDRAMDDDKLKLMQTVLADRTYYTDQLRTMVAWLSFEDNKLAFLKSSYDNTVDKDNYWKLEDVFSFSSSKDQLNDYVTARKPQVVNTRDDRDRSRPMNDRDRNRPNDRNHDYEYNNVNPRAMSDQDINDLGARVKDRMGDSDKLKLAESVMGGKEVYTDQLRTVMSWFSFESTKLDFAKWAYTITLDKENYWKLEDMFSFSSSKDELSDYVQAQKR